MSSGRTRIFSDEERAARHRAACRSYRASERGKEQRRKDARSYQKRHPGKVNSWNMKRHATKLMATPKWLTKEQILEIESIYENTPVGFEVDHIVPLQGAEVRGLHVPWNLQHLEKSVNRQKHNRMVSL